MSNSALEDLIALVIRDLGADDVRVVEAADPTAGSGALHAELPDGRVLVVHYDRPPPDLSALERRFEMLLSSFDENLTADALDTKAARSSPVRSLRDELAALSKRAGAIDALVIDAHSPVVWGSAARDLFGEGDAEMESIDSEGQNDSAGSSVDRIGRALEAVRALPDIETLPRGGHIHHTVSEDDFGYVARSFAGIYLLLLVFDTAVDEIRAKRAIVHSLSTIEHLVLSLPPIEPPPALGGQMVVRRPRRRRT